MKAYELQESFGFDRLHLVDREDPEPDEDEVLVRIRAVSINFRDLMVIRGDYNPNQSLPLVPLSDGAGEVEAVGANVDRFEVGDRVIPIFAQDWTDGELTRSVRGSTLGSPLDGTLRQRAVFGAGGLVPVPDHLTLEQAATLPCAGLTAWNALTKYRRTTDEDTVLLQGTGGVSIFGLQFASALGARTVLTSSRDEKRERAEAMGADHTINYESTPDWDEAVREWTDGRGVDCVVEVGGAGTLQKSLSVTAPAGQISIIGVLSGGVGDLNILPILMKTLSLQGIFVGSRRDFEQLLSFLDEREIEPCVDRTFDFEALPEALEYVAEGQHVGKVVVRV